MTATLRIARLLALPLVFATAACDNPVDHEEHPEGLVVLDASGTEVARYMVDGQVLTGQIVVAVDVATTFTVQAVAEDGDVIEIDGDELTLQIEGVRPGWTATLSGDNEVTITATAAGGTPLAVTLFHNDHPEFVGTFEVVTE